MKGQFVRPEVFILGETRVNQEGLNGFLQFLGVPEWKTDAASDAEKLCEVAGKLCYMSFSTDLNKNLTKVGTRNNYDYLQNGIIKTKHGSVLEHSSVTLALMNVSRVVTHEIVRHRAGAAYSQVSGRYVRTDQIDMYLPSDIQDSEEATEVFRQAVTQMENSLEELAKIFSIDEMRSPEQFGLKKILTSAFRRLVGNGQANHIIASYNHRSLRHLIELRTDRHAEEEIRVVFSEVFKKVVQRYPAIYGDASVETVRGIDEIKFANSKV